ncbi:MAG: hypothetical protein ACRDSR_15325 [Pseudonocardiaceae bacterium]
MSIELESVDAERQGGGLATAEPVPVRCGRALPRMHLTELDVTVSQREHHRPIVTVCGATNVAEPDPGLYDYDGDEGCAGCADCFRYCSKCVDAAVRWLARTDPRG